MEIDKKYMFRCLELAELGAGSVAPNPRVGCVIVQHNKIIGEGFHREYGGLHAEVNAIKAVTNPEKLRESTLYVNLEPCAHHGLTPPCSDLIVEKQIPRVVIGTADPFHEVAGRGIKKLKNAGVEVEVGILEKECRTLNKRFFTFHEKKRPYIILKWAQTLDGFIDIDRHTEKYGAPTWITGDLALRLVHKIRSEENAILVGTQTAEKDNPSLTVRHWQGIDPLRILIDKELRLPRSLNLFDGNFETLVFNNLKNEKKGKTTLVKIDFKQSIIPQLFRELFRQKIQSVIVEGGRQLLQSFIDEGVWDEAHIYFGNKLFYNGIRAPHLRGNLAASEMLDNDKLVLIHNSAKSEPL